MIFWQYYMLTLFLGSLYYNIGVCYVKNLQSEYRTVLSAAKKAIRFDYDL